jgi:hypothetical protein
LYVRDARVPAFEEPRFFGQGSCFEGLEAEQLIGTDLAADTAVFAYDAVGNI